MGTIANMVYNNNNNHYTVIYHIYLVVTGDVRNDLYVNLIQGEFKKGTKTADKNVEVTMCVCSCKGEVLQVGDINATAVKCHLLK